MTHNKTTLYDVTKWLSDIKNTSTKFKKNWKDTHINNNLLKNEQLIKLYTHKKHTFNHITRILQSKKIGWQHFIHGRFSKLIIKLMHESAHQKLPKHFTPKKWLHELILIMLDVHTTSWVEYYKFKHEKLYNPVEQKNSIEFQSNFNNLCIFDFCLKSKKIG